MKRLILLFGLLAMAVPGTAQAQAKKMTDAELVGHLKQVYNSWRSAMVRKDAGAWKRLTSSTRQINVRNRLWSERRQFPEAVFAAPIAPPNIATLSAMRVRVKGNTAKAIYFGKVDFGVGGKPTDNVFVISYVHEATGWKYHAGEFVKLDAIPEVRKQLQRGDLKFFDSADFHPDGKLEPAPFAIRGPVKYIAKAYVFCPGREVKLLANKISPHLFQNTKRSEIIVGGARDGANELQYSIKDIAGGDPAAPITIRVYLMSQVRGTQPIKIAQYQIEDGSKPKASGTIRFNVTPEVAKKLTGQ
ncbi:nuclear transport factor 2 family protein [bacterium]|nr:nuclear transport factor 2 family protein [bacterium]